MNLEIETVVNDFPFYVIVFFGSDVTKRLSFLFRSCSFALLWRSW